MGQGYLCLRLTIAAAIVLQIQQEAPVFAQGSPLTLQAAVESAHQNNQLIEAARLAIAEAQGDLTGASLRLVDNLQVVASAGPRLPGMAGGDTKLQFEVGVEQVFQTGGERGHRINRAQADIGAATARAEDVQRVVDLAVASTFYETLAAEQRLELLEQNERLARDLHDVAVRRLDAGEGTPLELNTARIRLAEVQRRTMGARGTREAGAVRLAELLGISPATPIRFAGDLPADEESPPAEALVDRAVRSRPDLAAMGQRIESAIASLDLARAVVKPPVAVGVFYKRDDGDNIVVGGVRLPIPFSNKNQGGQERARATRARLVAEQNLLRLSIESEVRQALLAYDQARRAFQLYDSEVLRAQEESADLLQLAFEAGEVGVPDVIVVQRELLDGREGYLETRLDLALTRARVLAGTYQSQTGPLLGGTP